MRPPDMGLVSVETVAGVENAPQTPVFASNRRQYRDLTAPQRRHLLEILEDRYQRRSTLVTSQLPVEHWHKTIGEPTHADAILDRLVHNAYRIALRGESMRKLNAKGGMRLNDKS